MKLGQLLLHRGLIDREQLRVALARQSGTGRPLGETLLVMGIVSRAELIAALRRQPRAQAGDALRAPIPESIRNAIPEELAREVVAVPIARADDALVVAMADPTDGRALERLRSAAGTEIVAMVADADEILAVLETATVETSAPALETRS